MKRLNCIVQELTNLIKNKKILPKWLTVVKFGGIINSVVIFPRILTRADECIFLPASTIIKSTRKTE